jgi:hypothetical protein
MASEFGRGRAGAQTLFLAAMVAVRLILTE